jgi:Family of unknown function (DUF6334)
MHPANTAQALLDAFHAFAPEKPEVLRAVYRVAGEGEENETLALDFTTKRLVFTADPDDDTIRLGCEPLPAGGSDAAQRIDGAAPWNSLLGREFGWGWVTINQQGYCDGVLLSFDGIVPTLLLTVAASALSVAQITPVEEAGRARPSSAP